MEWQEILMWVVGILILLLGSPLTQWLKNKIGIKNQWALVLTGLVSAAVASLELWLGGLLDFSLLSIETFPAMFTLVFTVATVYFKLLKGTDSFLGARFLLKE